FHFKTEPLFKSFFVMFPVVFGVAKVIKFLFLTSVCEENFKLFFQPLNSITARLRGAKVINFSFLTSLCEK
uniref:hypothetical protein n=1 Tax=Fluviicola sp. TaxID=1917219 RepID=UPI0031CE48D6